jgi:hypothetical protein
MSPYGALKTAVSRRGGVCTPWEVRDALAAYLKQFRVVAKTPEGKRIDWNDLYTREEWFALTNKKKRTRRKKGADPVMFVYDTVEDVRVEAKRHSPTLDGEHAADLEWIDRLAARHREEIDENGYNAEW